VRPSNATHWRRLLSLLAVDRLSFGHSVAKRALPRVVGETQAVLDRWCTLTGPTVPLAAPPHPMNEAYF